MYIVFRKGKNMVINVDKNNFKKEVLESKEPVLVDFNANWCGPCRMLRPILDEMSNDRKNCKIVSINVDDEEELAKKYGVISIPCLVVFKDGKEIERSVGLKPKEVIEEMMEDL